MKSILIAASLIAQQGCPTCDPAEIRESIQGQLINGKDYFNAYELACGAMLYVKGADKFLKECFGR
jgi:hypothetical protein